MPRGGPLCRKVFCADRIGRGHCVGRRPLKAEAPLNGGPLGSLGPQWYLQSFTHASSPPLPLPGTIGHPSEAAVSSRRAARRGRLTATSRHRRSINRIAHPIPTAPLQEMDGDCVLSSVGSRGRSMPSQPRDQVIEELLDRALLSIYWVPLTIRPIPSDYRTRSSHKRTGFLRLSDRVPPTIGHVPPTIGSVLPTIGPGPSNIGPGPFD